MKKVTHEDYLEKCKPLLEEGYEVLSEYTRASDKMNFKCPNGHKFQRIAKDFIRYGTCPYCSGKHQYTPKEFKQKVEQITHKKYTVLSDYINTSTKITFKHKECGYKFDMTPTNFLNGERCPKCARVKIIQVCKVNAENNTKTNDTYQEELKEMVGRRYSTLTKYQGKRKSITYKHNKCGNIFISNPDYFKSSFLKGYEPCPLCKEAKDVSNKELELRKFIESFYTKKIIYNDRVLLNGKELDIYLPEDNLAIEFNGLYWHSQEVSKGKCGIHYHLDKTEECEAKGVRLIHVFEDNWDNHNAQIKSKIKYILHESEDLERIRASKCYVKEISVDKKNKFLNTHHIQGQDKSTTYNLGLFTKERKQLVAVMTFTIMKNKYNQENDYNLSRFASHNKYIVNGAFSKLLKYFKENYEINDIYTFADRTWSIGDLYDKNNFVVDAYIRPDYKYYNHMEHELGLQHKFNFRKDKLARYYPDVYSDDKTEKQIMQELGYVRVWNCGLIRYKLVK
jgi:Zn ribbon nucleic-acid-binding protein